MRWRRFWNRTSDDSDHSREFQAFLEMETDDNVARGMPPESARRAAHLKFGNATALREDVYQMNAIGFLETLGRDVRYAVRVLLASPVFTVVSLLTLSLGIGATTAIFTVVNAVILRPLPFPDAGRLVTAWETHPSSHLKGLPPGCISFPPGNFLDLREQNHTFQQLGGFSVTSYNLTGGNAPDRVTGGLVSASLIAALGMRPAVGRLLVQSDDSPTADRVAVLSYSLWQERFGGSAAALGSTIRLDDKSHTIVGVMPAGFQLMNSEVDVWLPLERKITPEDMHWRQSYYLRVIGRLNPGVTLRQARADVDRIVQHIRAQYPGGLGTGGEVVPLQANTIARARGPLIILLGAVGFVLLIACANVANLNLGRAMARRREIALRLAIGASRFSVARQLFTESLLVALCGAAAGLCLAEWGVAVLLRLAPGEIPRAAEVHADAWVLVFTLLAAKGCALVSGLLPALSVSRVDLQEGLKSDGRSASSGPATLRARSGLVVSEIALALVLMIGAGLMIESFRRVSAVRPGFDPDGLITLRVALSPTRYDELDRQNRFYQQLLDRLRRTEGLLSVGAIDGLPFSGGGFDNAFVIDGRPDPPLGQPLIADIRRVDSGYFSTMRISLLAGRPFNEADSTDAPPVAIISQSMARKYWPNQSAVGQHLTLYYGPPGGIHAQVAGVVADVRALLDSAPNDYIYLHYPQGRSVKDLHLVLRPDARGTAAGTGTLVRAVREAVGALDAEQPVYHVRTMQELLQVSLSTRRFEMMLLGIFAALAGCLAAIGLYGVLAYSVQARTREIGIRTALGANHQQVLGMVLGQALKLAATGLSAGIVGAVLLTRLLANLLYDIQPTDPATFMWVSVLLLFVAVTAGYIPARRASRIDPLIALRHE